MDITIKLNTHGYNIGDMVEFRPHCGRKKTLTGKVIGYSLDRIWNIIPDMPIESHASLRVLVDNTADDNGIYTTSSWLDEKYCKKIN